MSDQTNKARAIKQRHEKEWLGIGGVTAVGLARVDDQIGIIISVTSHADKVRAQIPSDVEGIPVKIQVTGSLNAL